MRGIGFERWIAVVVAALILVVASEARTQQVVLNVGDPAPVFEARTDEGTLWRSTENVGNGLLVVYFYPAAMSDGCTKQACAFRDNRSQLQELGAEVVGVSGDRIDNLRAFKGSNRLNFPLLSDTTGAVARAFGVTLRDGSSMQREVDGREITLTRDVTAARWTFIIDRSGKIVYKDTQVNAEGDGAAVLRAVRRLNRS
jgi:thioredoxin-dependent peroxiredoxin